MEQLNTRPQHALRQGPLDGREGVYVPEITDTFAPMQARHWCHGTALPFRQGEEQRHNRCALTDLLKRTRLDTPPECLSSRCGQPLVTVENEDPVGAR